MGVGGRMTFLETVLAIVLAQIPTYFIQRYFFKHVMDKQLEKIESKAWNKIKGVWSKNETLKTN